MDLGHIFYGMRVSIGYCAGRYSEILHAQRVAIKSFLTVVATDFSSESRGAGEKGSSKRRRDGGSSDLEAERERVREDNDVARKRSLRYEKLAELQ